MYLEWVSLFLPRECASLKTHEGVGMFSSIRNLFGAQDLQVASLPCSTGSFSEKERRIREAYAAGYFDPFQKSLESQDEVEGSYRKDSCWDDLKKIATGTSAEAFDPARVGILSLFACLIRPHLEHAKKQAIIEEYLSSLTVEDKKFFFFSLSNKMPSCMAVSILRYSPIEVRREACRQGRQYHSVMDYKKGPCNWMKEVMENGGLYPKGEDFLDQLFQCYPEQEKKELVYYFFLHSDLREQEIFLMLLNQPLRRKVEQLLDEVRQFLDLSLNPSSSLLSISKGRMRIPFPFKSNQRTYFLRLFFIHALDRPESFLIAADFDEHDWQYLKASVKEQRTADLALRWMGQMVQFLVKKEQTGKEEEDGSLFFLRASEALPERFSDKQTIELKKIAQGFSCRVLARHHHALTTPLLQQLPPQTIADLLFLYIFKKRSWHRDGRRDTVEKEVREIWQTMRRVRDFPFIFDICFGRKDKPAFEEFELAVFSALHREEQLEVLSAILSHREHGISQLASWCIHCLTVDFENRLPLPVKILVFQQLQRALAEVDKTLPVELRATLERRFGVRAKLIDRLFPLVPLTSEQRQQRALDQLKQLFLNKEIVGEELRGLIDALHQDLQADMERSVWIPRLFEHLPKQMWPLLFFYFAHDLRHKSSPREKRPLSGPDWLPDTKRWIDLAAQTLVEVPSNPLSHDDNMHWGLQHFYHIVNETGTLTQVIEQFCVMAPAEKWIPALDTLGSAFSSIKEDFKQLLVDSIQQSGHSGANKIEFLAERYIAFDRARSGLKANRVTNLETALFDKPFIKTEGEALTMLDALTMKLGINFFGFFLRHNNSIPSRMVQAIQSLPDRGRAILLEWLEKLTQVGNSNETKMQVLQRIASNVSNRNPEECIAFFREPEFKGVAAKISTWYQADVETLAKMVDPSPSGWTLLNHFCQESFYPTIFYQLEGLQQKDEWLNIKIYFLYLSTMPCKQALMDKLLTEGSLSGFRRAYKEYVQKEGIGRILSSHVDEIGGLLALKLVDDWSVQLTQWAIENLQKERDDNFSWGDGKKLSYDALTCVYKTLDRAGAGVLSSWQRTLSASLPEELRQDFMAGNLAYQKMKDSRFEKMPRSAL